MSDSRERRLPPVRKVSKATNAKGVKTFRLNMPVDDYLLLRVSARKAGRTMTRYLLECLRPPVTQVDGELLRELMGELLKLNRQLQGEATNLNQIAHWANAEHAFPGEAHSLIRQVRKQVTKVEQLCLRISDLL